jgi:hypothetical protein
MGEVFEVLYLTNPQRQVQQHFSQWRGAWKSCMHDLAPLTSTADSARSVLRLSSCGIAFGADSGTRIALLPTGERCRYVKCQNRGHRCIGAVLQ